MKYLMLCLLFLFGCTTLQYIDPGMNEIDKELQTSGNYILKCNEKDEGGYCTVAQYYPKD